MNSYKIKQETRDYYQNLDKKSLKNVIFFTKVFKNMLTKNGIFIGTLIFPLVVILFSTSLFTLCVGIVVHFIIYQVLIKWFFTNLENDHNEQQCIQDTLEEMLKEKQ